MPDSIQKKTVCLAMIVKNEGHLIIETFNHLAQFIKFDYWVINDNGSTDGTQDLIRNYFKEKGIPGELDETPWKDFAYNRTVAFNVAYKKTDYVFVWDADDEISGDFKFPTDLKADSYKFIFGNESGLRYSRCQLFNNHLKWHYVGVLHEYPACLEKSGPTTDVNGNYYFISGRKGDRSKDPNKYLKDALILEKAFEEAYEKKDGIYNRYAFYTAQSYNSCGRHEKAIEFYKKVLTLDNWLQEKYFSCLEIYNQYEHLKQEEEGLRFLVESFRYDRKRVECIYRLIKYYCIKGLNDVSFAYYTLIQEYYENQYIHDDISLHLFAKKEEYDFYLPYYMVIVSDRMNRFDTAAKMLKMIFKQNYLHSGAWWIHNLFHNIQFSIQAFPKDLDFLESMLTYINNLRSRNVNLTVDNYKNVDKIIAYYRPLLTAPSDRVIPTKPLFSQGKVKVMLTVTTCKRFDLFEQTINSMKRNWLDMDTVDYFFCVDDNSSVEDRMKMQTQYPFFNYYMKAADEKGHRESMNIIYEKLKEIQPTYWIHMEDDWVYFKSENYVTKGIQMLEKYREQQIHQLVFNRTYGLMMEDMKRVGGCLLEPGIWLHEQKEVQGPNCAYWPHYSLQPSIIRTEVILELGNYDSPNKFFERDYANKYGAKGYKTMFFDSIHSLHIGKQHWETDGKNAYALNEVGQFNIGALQQKVVEIKEKQENVPLTGSMKNHLEQILLKIESGTYFGLIRPSDGEHTVLKGDTLTNCDGWTFSKGSVLQQQLLSAIQTVDQNLYIGIPCNTCNKPWNCTDEIYNNFIDTWKVPLAQRTYANLVGNSNWKRFSEFMKSYNKGFFLITSGTAATELPVKERFIIDSKLVNQWDTLGVAETERLKRFVAGKKDQLICFSAGPLSKYWIPLCMKLNPNNMYVDVGASLDVFMKGGTNRSYTNSNHPFSKERCTFKDSLDSITLVPKAKNLLYMCVFNNKDYVELLKILLTTLKLFSNLDGIDVLVLTSANLVPMINDISELIEVPIFTKICEYTDLHECICARFTVFNYQYIGQYEKIVYIDTDIIVQNDVSKIFATNIEDKIYALPEGTIEHEYHGGWFFDFETIDKNTVGMNSGILYFKNSEQSRTIFKDINEHTKKLRDANEKLPTTVDQPFLNYHTIKGGNQDTNLMTQFALIYCIDPPPPPSAPTTVSLCHFVWPIGNANHKKDRMRKHMDHIFNTYTVIYNSSPPENNPVLGKTYRWGTGPGVIRFEKDLLVTTWAKGEYKWLDSHTLEANWSGYNHILRMNETYTSFINIRKGDFNVGTGVLLV
jgi:tetratricopeptide (TPR) repeat protein